MRVYCSGLLDEILQIARGVRQDALKSHYMKLHSFDSWGEGGIYTANQTSWGRSSMFVNWCIVTLDNTSTD